MHSAPTAEHVSRKLCQIKLAPDSELSRQLIEFPRLPEVLWFLEWQRRQPGGMDAFARGLIEHAGNAILPEEFWDLAVDKEDRFSADAVFLVWSKLPRWARPPVPGALKDALELAEAGGVTSSKLASEAGLTKQTVDALRSWLTRRNCVTACAKAAAARLPGIITDFFYLESDPLPRSISWSRGWRPRRGSSYTVLGGLPARIAGYMDAHAAAECAKIAPTRIAATVFEAVEFAGDSQSLVMVMGKSRYGKTESLSAWCNAHPGKARLVRTPSTSGQKVFLLRIAGAIGLNCDESSSLGKIREAVCFALRHSGLTLIFDESHFLIPANYSSTTVPERLNFIRTEIIDAGRGCVLSATPQAHRDSFDKFVRKTHYAMEQWLGRIVDVFKLPEKLSPEDAVKVTKMRLPGVSDETAQLIAAKGMETDQFLHGVTAIAKRAAWLARRAGRSEPTLDEIEAAFESFRGVCGEIESIVPQTRSPKQAAAPAALRQPTRVAGLGARATRPAEPTGAPQFQQ